MRNIAVVLRAVGMKKSSCDHETLLGACYSCSTSVSTFSSVTRRRFMRLSLQAAASSTKAVPREFVTPIHAGARLHHQEKKTRDSFGRLHNTYLRPTRQERRVHTNGKENLPDRPIALVHGVVLVFKAPESTPAQLTVTPTLPPTL